MSVVTVGLVTGIVFLLVLQRYAYALQYSYFLRYPILLALGLAALPLAARAGPSSPFANLFSVTGVGHQIALGLSVSMASWCVAYTGGILWTHLPDRTSLAFWKRDTSRPRAISAGERSYPANPPILGPRVRGPVLRTLVYLAVGLVPAAPLLVTCMAHSDGFGLLVPVGVAVGATPILGWAWLVSRSNAVAGRIRRVAAAVARVPAWIDERLFGREDTTAGRTGFEDEPRSASDTGFHDFTHARAVVFAGLTLLVYGLGYFMLGPTESEWSLRDEFPVLAYLMGLVGIAAWVLPWAAFEFDKYRVPAEVVLVTMGFVVYTLTGTDHYYALPAADAASLASRREPPISLEEYAERRAMRDGSARPLVIVTASGGGIVAGYWTATVLTRLCEALGPEFERSIALVSTTSGGGLGAMYFVDRYASPGEALAADRSQLAKVREHAGATSLAAMSWGLLYPDFLRLTFPPLAVRDDDRGWAIERRWAQGLRREPGGGPPTLGDWARGVREGWRPAVLFNATFSESGERFAITNLDMVVDLGDRLGASSERGIRTLASTYPGHDMPVTTAARLSAAFPWVTPLARPLPEVADAYHVGDGGYYDNYGVVGAVEYLRAVLPAFARAGGRRVLLVQIRSSDSSRVAPPHDNQGFRLATLGPALTMLAVRNSSQLARNRLDLDLVADRWRENEGGLEIETVELELKRAAPLSWHLSSAEKAAIGRYWDAGHPHIEVARRRLGRFFGCGDRGCREDADPVATPDVAAEPPPS